MRGNLSFFPSHRCLDTREVTIACFVVAEEDKNPFRPNTTPCHVPSKIIALSDIPIPQR